MLGLALPLCHACTDEELLNALRQRQPDACTCLVQRFTPLVYRPVARIMHDSDDTEEVMQLTFIKACEKFDTFEDRSRLSTWLYRIATNEALMQRRRQSAHQVSLLSIAEQTLPTDLPHHLHSVPASPVQVALTTELRTQIAIALRALPESLQRVFVLRDVQHFSTEETAALVGISEGAVKVRLHRARQQLRGLLHEYVMGEAGGLQGGL